MQPLTCSELTRFLTRLLCELADEGGVQPSG
jgi:hypothetical protein